MSDDKKKQLQDYYEENGIKKAYWMNPEANLNT